MTDEQIEEYLDPQRNPGQEPDDQKNALKAALCVPGGGAEIWNVWIEAWAEPT